jgi:hypothetical protein
VRSLLGHSWGCQGIELVSDMSVGPDGGIEGTCEVLLSMADIQQLVGRGAAAVASFLAAVLTEIYLCNVCSC